MLTRQAETFIDCTPELIEQLLHFQEHGVRIVGVRQAGNILRFYIEGEALPAGAVSARFRTHVDGTFVLEGLDPA